MNIQVSSAYGPGIKYNGLGRNYRWLQLEDQPISPQAMSLVRGDIERGLSAKGFFLRSADPVNFLVRCRVARKSETDSSVSPFGVVVEEGALILEVLDAGNQTLIWRSIASARLNDSDPPDVRERRIHEAVRRMLQDFPAAQG